MDDRTIVFSFDRKLGARLFEVYEHQDESRSFAPRRRPAPSAAGPNLRLQRRRLAELCEREVVDFQVYCQLLTGIDPS
jgi:hypothetical protein